MAEVKDLLVTLEVLKNVRDHDNQETNKKFEQVNGALNKKVPFRYITVTVKSTEGDTDIPTTITTSIGGAVYSTVAYDGAPVALAIPDGISYQITASSEVHHGDSFYYDPTPLEGVASKDAQAEIIYSKLGAIHSFADVKRISDMGLAPQYFKVGDVLTTTYEDVNGTKYECPWVVVSTEGATLADGTVKESGVHLQMQYATIESIQFDAPEKEKATEETAQEGLYYYGFDGTNYTFLNLSAGDAIPYSDYTEIYHNEIKDTSLNIVRYGYNRDSHSAQEQWVNSAAGKGEWWEAKHIGDTPPNERANYRGFLAGFDADFLGALSEIQITRALNTVSEPDKTLARETRNVRMYLPSLEQMYIVPQADGVEGNFFPYYKQLAEGAGVSGKFAQGGTYPILISYALNAKSSAQNVRLASASRGNSTIVWNVNSSGYVSYNYASNSARCRPVCFI